MSSRRLVYRRDVQFAAGGGADPVLGYGAFVLVQEVLRDLPVRLHNAPRGTRVRPETVSVTLKGPRRALERIDPKTFEAIVEIDPATLDGQTTLEKAVALRPELPEPGLERALEREIRERR